MRTIFRTNYEGKLNSSLERAVGFFETPVDAHKRALRIREMPLGDFVADGLRWRFKTDVGLAQNMFYEESGAFTGEVSGEMLKAIGVRYVILGHSERRQYFAETDEAVNKKTLKALALGLTPIVCCGETLEEREADKAEEKVVSQIKAGLAGIDDITKVIVAYEPIWAIGTGKTASNEQADEACGWVRAAIADMYGKEAAEATRVQYGGSVKPANVKELMAMDNIDGALVGGASLTADFAKIVNYDA